MFPRRQLTLRRFPPLALAGNVTVEVAKAVYVAWRQETAMVAQLGLVGAGASPPRSRGKSLFPRRNFWFLSAMRQKVLRQLTRRSTAETDSTGVEKHQIRHQKGDLRWGVEESHIPEYLRAR